MWGWRPLQLSRCRGTCKIFARWTNLFPPSREDPSIDLGIVLALLDRPTIFGVEELFDGLRSCFAPGHAARSVPTFSKQVGGVASLGKVASRSKHYRYIFNSEIQRVSWQVPFVNINLKVGWQPILPPRCQNPWQRSRQKAAGNMLGHFTADWLRRVERAKWPKWRCKAAKPIL